MNKVVVIAHDIRSTHNVGSLLRTADGLGISKIYLTGYTPYPTQSHDSRLPHVHTKLTKQINKTALGAEQTNIWEQQDSVRKVIDTLRGDGFVIAALEQTKNSIILPSFKPPKKLCIVLGREVEGIEQNVLDLCDLELEIPMFGEKESFNVAQAAAIAMYHCTFF